jgi:hypothetical protein
MKAEIKFDFLQLFLYEQEISEDDILDIDHDNLTEWNKGDEVEVLKVIDSEDFSGGKGYVIYNPKNHKSITVAYHVIDFLGTPKFDL